MNFCCACWDFCDKSIISSCQTSVHGLLESELCLFITHQTYFLSLIHSGTRIIYDRKFLLDCRNSPLARTPPCCLPQIPGVTVPATHPMGKLQDLKEEAEEEEKDIAGNLKLKPFSLWVIKYSLLICSGRRIGNFGTKTIKLVIFLTGFNSENLSCLLPLDCFSTCLTTVYRHTWTVQLS